MNFSFKNKALIQIFFLLFIDILSFGMIIPLSPILAREFGADGLQVGWLVALYSLAQFIFAPFWGRLSDVFGRKPILLCGLVGVACSHLLFAFSTTLTMLFVSRLLAGFFGGNIATSMAYIADVTEKKHRSKNMGLIGLGFGLGFTLGPALGGLFILMGNQLGVAPPFGASFSAIGAALVSFMNFSWAFFFLKESLSYKSFSYLSRFKESFLFVRPSLSFILDHFKQPVLGQVLFMSFLLWFALSQIEPTLILLVQDDFFWSKNTTYMGFAYIGVLMAFGQGFLVRKLIPRWGEKKVNVLGLLLAACGLFCISASLIPTGSLFFLVGEIKTGLLVLAFGVTLFSLGYSLSNTSLSGAISLLGPSSSQGSLFGVNQSLSSIARIGGPIFGGWVYRDLSHGSPFVFSGIFAVLSLALACKLWKVFPNSGKKTKKPEDSDDFYSVDLIQFQNLIEKRIPFKLFRLFSESPLEAPLLKQSEFGTEEEILFKLRAFDKSQPIVFICETELVSKRFAKKVRERGWANTYYILKGIKAFEEVEEN